MSCTTCETVMLFGRMQLTTLRKEIMLASFPLGMAMRAMNPPGWSPRILKAIAPFMADLS